MRSLNDKNIQGIINNKYTLLGKLCGKSIGYVKLNKIVLSAIDKISPNNEQYFKVNSFQKGCLLIDVARSEFLTSIKYQQNNLISELRKHKEFYNLITLKFKIQPAMLSAAVCNSKTKESKDKPKLSDKSKTCIKQIAQNIKNSALKNALLKLIK